MEQMWLMVGVFVIIYGLCSLFQMPFVKKQMLENYTEESVDKYCKYCGIPMMIFGVAFVIDAYSSTSEVFAILRWILYALGAIPIVIFSFKILEKKNNAPKKFFNSNKKNGGK